MTHKVLQYIYDRMPTQQKKIEKTFAERPEMKGDLEAFLMNYQAFFAKRGFTAESLAASYLNLINHTLHARLEFVRTGCYPVSSQAKVKEEVYENSVVMTNHLLGLALSLFLWRHHYDILTFYRDWATASPQGGNLLEVGSGHGLFAIEMIKANSMFSKMDIVDISPISLEITHEIISTVQPEKKDRINFLLQDITYPLSRSVYSRITMGEVLEHVEEPLPILISLRSLLAEQGQLFITTCVNSPAIDHVYHFHNVEEIRNMIQKAGFLIKDELIAPSEQKSDEWLAKNKIDISYAAVLEGK